MSSNHSLEPAGVLVSLVSGEGLLLSFLLAGKQFEMPPNSVGCQQWRTEKEKVRLLATALSPTNWVVSGVLLNLPQPVLTAVKQ